MNPLFKKFADSIKQAKNQSDLVKLARKAVRSAGRGKTDIGNLSKIRSGMREVSRTIKTGEKMAYGRLSQLIKDTIWNETMRALGPLGSLIGAMIRPSQRALTSNIEKEIKAAADLLQQFGYEVTPPSQRQGPGTGLSTPINSRKAPQVTPTEPLSTPGERVGETPVQQGVTDQKKSPTGRAISNFVVKNVNGQRFRIRRDDPLLTGQMIKVKSSNVHSIGYLWNDEHPEKGTLQVRFLDHRKQSGKNNKKAGAAYQYFEVHPKVFVAFTTAASKGKFVWDRLRIRGTVSGHQYRYALSMISSDGYVPRKARRIGDQEYFLRRTVKDKNGKVYRSELPNRHVGPYNPTPNRGTPNRGKPNRGEPNRGR